MIMTLILHFHTYDVTKMKQTEWVVFTLIIWQLYIKHNSRLSSNPNPQTAKYLRSNSWLQSQYFVKKTLCFKVVLNNSELVILTMTYTLYSVKILEYLLCKYAILPVTVDESFNQVASMPHTYWKYQLWFKEDITQNPMPPFCTFQNDSSKISQT